MSGKKVLYVVNILSYFISHRLSIATYAGKQGYKIYIAAPAASMDQIKLLEQAGFIYVKINYIGSYGGFINELKFCYSIYKIIKQVKPDVVHNIYLKIVIVSGCVARFLKIPRVINTIPGFGFLFTSDAWREKLYKIMVKPLLLYSISYKKSILLLQNNDDKKYFENKYDLKFPHIVLIRGTGINVEKIPMNSFPNRSPVTVAFPARFLLHKGIMEFYYLAKKFQDNPDVKFVLIGDIYKDNPTSISRNVLNKWEQSDVLENWGWQSDICMAFAEVDIVCLPSYREGLPRVLLEAAACGKAIVTTNVPGCREIVKHDLTGLLVELGNQDSLNAAVKKLLYNKGLRERLGRNARVEIEKNYTEAYVNEETIKLYHLNL